MIAPKNVRYGRQSGMVLDELVSERFTKRRKYTHVLGLVNRNGSQHANDLFSDFRFPMAQQDIDVEQIQHMARWDMINGHFSNRRNDDAFLFEVDIDTMLRLDGSSDIINDLHRNVSGRQANKDSVKLVN